MTHAAADSSLPPLDQLHSLGLDVAEGYRRDGHTVVRGLASAEEVAAYRPHIVAACDSQRYETRPLAERDTYGKAFLQYWGLAAVNTAVARFVHSRRFAKLAADLMGVDAVCIYHDQALLKEPGGGPTPLHQDQYYWPIDDSPTITMWMPLVPVTAEIGSMTFVSGSHRSGHENHFEISDRSEAEVRALIAERGLATVNYGALAPGDATFHAGWTLHGAPANPTNEMREVMTVIYFAADVHVIQPEKHQQGDFESWLAGYRPGQIIAGPQHPVVWARTGV